MRVAVIQSSYIPWRGYFDVIRSVDKFVIYDDVQYSTGSWRNRNKLKTPEGLRWISVPVHTELGLAIDQVRIGRPRKPWRDEHRRLLHQALEQAPYFEDVMRLWEEGVQPDVERLSELNLRLTRLICDYFSIATPLVMSRDYAAQGNKTTRLIDLLKKLGATAYLSGPAAKDYIDLNLFGEARIRLEYKTYDYVPYPQLWGNFEGAVTALDLIANCGPQAVKFLTSCSPHEVAVAI